MSDLLQKLKAGTSNVKVIDWPGSTPPTKVALRVLSQRETQEATFATERLFKFEKIDIGLATADEYQAEVATQMLYRSLRDPANLDEPIAANITIFKSSLTREEKKFLVDEYMAFEKECSPSIELLSNDELDKLLSDVKKNPEAGTGNVSSIATARKLISYLVKQLETSQKGSGFTSGESSKK